MKKVIFHIVQWIWGFPQNILGLLLFLVYLRKPHFRFHGAIATDWGHDSSLSLGIFLFIGGCAPDRKEKILVHEFGHSIQSLFLGPLFLPVMGLPSLLWAGLPHFQKLRLQKSISYYAFYPEAFANYLGEHFTGSPAPK